MSLRLKMLENKKNTVQNLKYKLQKVYMINSEINNCLVKIYITTK